MVYVFPLLVWPYAKILAITGRKKGGKENTLVNSWNASVQNKLEKDRESLNLTVNAINYREGNCLRCLLVYFFGIAVSMEYPVCSLERVVSKKMQHSCKVREIGCACLWKEQTKTALITLPGWNLSTAIKLKWNV
jgi:hypothetical protein